VNLQKDSPTWIFVEMKGDWDFPLQSPYTFPNHIEVLKNHIPPKKMTQNA